MKKELRILAVLLLVFTLAACDQTTGTAENTAVPQAPTPAAQTDTGGISTQHTEEPDGNHQEVKEQLMKLTIGETVWTAALADNSSADALKEMLAEGPLTIAMHDYANMEKVGPLGTNLPTNDEQITTEPGDLILYQGNALVIYYAPNSWSFTRLGKIEGVTQQEMMDVLGKGNIEVTLTMANGD